MDIFSKVLFGQACFSREIIIVFQASKSHCRGKGHLIHLMETPGSKCLLHQIRLIVGSLLEQCEGLCLTRVYTEELQTMLKVATNV